MTRNQIEDQAEVIVFVRYAKYAVLLVLGLMLLYLGLAAICHFIGFCFSESCEMPYYSARHIIPSFVIGFVLLLPVVVLAVALQDTWDGAVDHEAGLITEREKAREIE